MKAMRSEMLKKAVKEATVAKFEENGTTATRLGNMNIENHTPCEETEESIDKWETVTCKASGRFGRETEETNYYERTGNITVSAEIKSYDTETNEFTVYLPNIPIIEPYP